MYRKCKRLTYIIIITSELKHRRSYTDKIILTRFNTFAENIIYQWDVKLTRLIMLRECTIMVNRYAHFQQRVTSIIWNKLLKL